MALEKYTKDQKGLERASFHARRPKFLPDGTKGIVEHDGTDIAREAKMVHRTSKVAGSWR